MDNKRKLIIEIVNLHTKNNELLLKDHAEFFYAVGVNVDFDEIGLIRLDTQQLNDYLDTFKKTHEIITNKKVS